MRPTMFDRFQLKAAAVFSYDIPTPQIGQGGAEAAILTGDMAHIWHWTRMAKMPSQESMENMFASASVLKKRNLLRSALQTP